MSAPHDARHGAPRWRRIALPASVILNLFLAAVIAGHLWHVRRGDAVERMPLARALARIETSLPPQDAAAFLSAMRLNAPRYLDAAQRLREARREVGRQIAAEPFDEAAVKQALVAWQAAWNGFIDDFSGPLVDALAQISTEGRRKLIAERRAAGSGVP